MSPAEEPRSARRTATRRLAYAVGGVVLAAAAVLATTAEDSVLGSPEDFERLVRAPFDPPRYSGVLENEALSEVSGIAPSRLRDDLLWAINDSGNEPALYAVGTDGRDLGSVRLEGAKNRDWEDIASYRLPGEAEDPPRSYLLIADIGDNRSRQKVLSLYAVEEPQLAGTRFAEDAVANVAWRQDFQFEDGPRDAEGIAVDVPGKQILVVSKRDYPAQVYALPLPLSATEATPANGDEAFTATRIALLETIPQPTEADLEEDKKHGATRSQPTALDIAPDARSAIILTYKHAYYYARESDETWHRVFSGDPQVLPLPPMQQSEAGAFSKSAESFYVTSEKRPAPLFEAPRTTPTAPADERAGRPSPAPK